MLFQLTTYLEMAVASKQMFAVRFSSMLPGIVDLSSSECFHLNAGAALEKILGGVRSYLHIISIVV